MRQGRTTSFPTHSLRCERDTSSVCGKDASAYNGARGAHNVTIGRAGGGLCLTADRWGTATDSARCLRQLGKMEGRGECTRRRREPRASSYGTNISIAQVRKTCGSSTRTFPDGVRLWVERI